MADRLDVAERLAEGGVAVDHTQRYMQACHALGYQHPDLTSHPTQIRDWYDSEEGLDLRALDRDCAELRAAGAAAMEALQIQRAQVAELAAAWTGPGADAAVGLLQRHCDTANAVVVELRAAAQRCESLRDNLWYLVDAKVATAIAVDDRTQAQRQAWLAAAAVVTTGVGDRPSAEEVVRQQVMPYVTEDIRNDWLTTMRSTLDGVATSYDMVTDRMAAAPAARFEFPGDLGPGHQPVQPAGPPSTPIPAGVAAPAAPSPPADSLPVPTSTTAIPAPALTSAAPAPTAATPMTPGQDWGTALGDASGMPAGDLGGGLSGLGGLAGLAGRIVDAMGELFGSAGDDLGAMDPLDEDPFHADDESADEPDEPDETKQVDDTEDTKPGDEAQPVNTPTPADESTPSEAPAQVASVPAPVAAPPPEPMPPAKEGSTPCEIAADQLPQAGQ